MEKEKIKIVFFGSSEFSVYVLDELKLHNILPSLIVTTPDKAKGRKLILTPTPVKIWAKQNNIEVITPEKLKDPDLIFNLQSSIFNLFLVASYGKIIPPEIFNIPQHKTLNIHPSLLPKYRGASPIQSQILNNEQNIGVSIMQIDEGMDTGPIVIKKQVASSQHLASRKELEKILAIEGARLFAHILPEWLMGAIDPIVQNETEATYSQKIGKKDGELDIDLNNLEKNAFRNFLKIKAFEDWPSTWFIKNNKRIKITDAKFENGELKILRVIPEGKSEMPFADFLRGLR